MDLEIYDCTLREGEQAEGASFNLDDRIKLCEELDDFGVDSNMLASAIEALEKGFRYYLLKKERI